MEEKKPVYFTGLDLGQTQDFTAIAVLEKSITPEVEESSRRVSAYAVRHLERFPLGTPYTDVSTRVAQLFASAPLTDTTLAVDQTGVGRPVIDMLWSCPIKAHLRPVTITGGNKASTDGKGGWHVPKKELVSTLQVLLQSRRIKVARSLPAAPTLVQELLNFQIKVTPSANEQFGTWREGAHDDLVLAVAIAAWAGERGRRFDIVL